jgi:hypothetical protein
MDVEMKHRLSRTRTHVEHGAVPVFDVALTGDVSRRQMTSANQFRVFGAGFFQSGKMLLGDH